MTKHDDDASERAAPVDDLVERYRELEEACLRLQADLDVQAAENKSLRRELTRTRERLAYYQRLATERYGFEPKPPPGAVLDE
jgi:hypothetical protein